MQGPQSLNSNQKGRFYQAASKLLATRRQSPLFAASDIELEPVPHTEKENLESPAALHQVTGEEAASTLLENDPVKSEDVAQRQVRTELIEMPDTEPRPGAGSEG